MSQYIDKNKIELEIKKHKLFAKDARNYAQENDDDIEIAVNEEVEDVCSSLLSFLNTLEVKEVDLMIHTIIAECCDWLVMNTNLSHDEIEGCRNLMLTVKEEQLKTEKGE